MNSPSLSIVVNGTGLSLGAGESTAVPASNVYQDATNELMAAIQQDIAKGVAWREAATQHLAKANPWLLRIVVEPSRTRWLELNPPRKDSWVLDVGSGWGQWAVPAAAHAHVVAVEPSPVRLAMVRAIAEQEGRAQDMYFVGAPLQELQFPDRTFDYVYCVGVLEWIPKYVATANPIDAQRQFLRCMHALTAPKGECIIGIENRLGLKYLLGARDDHTGIPGISLLDADSAAKRYAQRKGQPLRIFTHTLVEYRALILEAGFGHAEFFAAFPDYKVSQEILSIADGSANRHCLKGKFIPEHDGSNGTPLPFQEDLASHYQSLAQLGCAGAFAPSFFIRARR